ncbi:MAG: ABC transporter ATP-binding protein, partial [Hyphomicrobiales bacterium]
MLQVENLTKLYAPGQSGGGIRNVSFDIADGEFYTLLGPSGCGKTTTLRSVAGLEEPSSGRMTIADQVIFDSAKRIFVPANQRRLGMVFQSYAVWPHMSVFDNTAFPLRMLPGKRWGDPDIRQLTMRTLETVGLAEFSARSAAQLSGGQQQRLALARALVAEPSLLLLDEPLSNLDALLREQMRSELRRLQKDVGVTAVYVTHDQSEALALSDRIAIMHKGRIAQIGTPQQIYHQPRNAFVATFIGRSNLFRGELLERKQSGGARIASALGPVLCEAPGDTANSASTAA